MEYKRFIQLMNDPGNVETETVASLQELIKEFPYFQSAHLLLARSMKEQEHIRYERQLKLASAYAPDRKVLFSLLHDKKNKQESPSKETETVIPSPFILVDEKEIDVAEQELNRDALINNPFIEPNISIPAASIEDTTSSEKAEPEISKTPNPKPSIPELPKEIAAEMQEILPQATKSANESATTDPREILKRRLSEILGSTEQQIPKASGEEERKSTPITATTEVTLKTSGEHKENLEDKKASDPTGKTEEPLVSSDNIIEPPSSISEPSASDILSELLPGDSNKPLDTIEKLELEYAMEDTLLSSLENLPVIKESEKHVEAVFSMDETAPEPAVENLKDSTRSFSSWLQKLSGKEFGQVEVVHADDAPGTSLDERQNPAITTQAAKEAVYKPVTKQQAVPKTEPKRRPGSQADEGISRQKKELIDKFIATEPKIVPSKIEFYSPVTQAKRSLEEYDDVVSETLASIYRQQGNHLKARFCYEKLSLFYPEKRTYFAALIKEIDEELNRSNQEDL